MRRLYLQFYLTALGIIVLFALLSGAAWFLHAPETEGDVKLTEGVGIVLGDLLPSPDQSLTRLQTAVERYGSLFPVEVAVYDAGRTLLASHGHAPDGRGPPECPVTGLKGGIVHARGSGFTVAIPLPDRRWVVARRAPSSLHRALGGLLTLGLLALAIGVGALPVARRLTRRLERLQSRVEALGAGELSSRVDVEGQDEVAQLARSFNRTADRIEHLVNAQRTMLAGASHELRSPLARIRVALELLHDGEARPELHSQVSADIAELDQLIGEILLASRLEALDEMTAGGVGGESLIEEVDLLALMAQESARVDARISGDDAVLLRGDRRLLTRLGRNLLENARRYGGDSAIDVTVQVEEGTAICRIRVEDRGPGVPEEDREKIFLPFYRRPGTREEGDGVGLGLFLVSRIAQHHGGDVRCSPRDGGGTRFEVFLPMHRE